jgi:hypothetical protein
MSITARYLTDETPADEVNPLQHLLNVCDEVSVEAFNVGNLGDWFSRKGAQISSALTEAFRYLTTADFSRPETLNSRQLRTVLATVQYTELSTKEAHIPVGLKGTMGDYAATLGRDVSPLVDGLLSNVILPAQKRFGHYLSNPNDVKERREFSHGSQYSLEQLEKVKAAMAYHLVAGNRSSTREYGEVFDNNLEIVNVCDQLNTINASRWAKANPQEMEKQVGLLIKIATSLFDHLSEGAGANASAQFTKMVADELRNVALWVEWYAVAVTQITDATVAMKANEKQLMAI